ncbi:MAG: M48 family metallopeptidase [Ramlibacter sp.]|nr:M48 family metallopeptidase [Ramlibacter sp.]
MAAPALNYLQGYPQELQAQAGQLLQQGRLGRMLAQKYPAAHEVRTDRSLYGYVQALKTSHLRSSEPLSKVCFDNKLHVIAHALGTHTVAARVQGGRLKTKREIRIASLFKDVPEEFLRMIAVHELAHLREKAHDKAFYQLCTHMEPAYHQLELDLRLYLTHVEATGERLWAPPGTDAAPAF